MSQIKIQMGRGLGQPANRLPRLPMTDAPDPYLGRVLKETYRLDRLLGRGGMGAVYEAGHQRLPKRFAVKVLVRPTGADPGLKDRFLREAEICSRIEHDNVVDIVDFDQTPEGDLYMVMELLQGEDLAARLQRSGRLDGAGVVWMFGALCGAVEAAHRLNVVHRDLKPGNIFLHRKGGRQTVKVLDFGIAKLRTEASALTVSGTLVGTPYYMSPEQIEGRAVDARTDVFALGAILFEAVSGKVAFEGASLAQVAHLIVYEKRPALNPDHPLRDPLQPILDRCLAVRPEERFQNVNELWAALKQAVEPRVDPELVAAWSVVTADGPPLPHNVVSQVAQAPTVAADVATGPPAPVDRSARTERALTQAEPEQAEADDLDLKSFSTLTILRQKKIWIIGVAVVLIGVAVLASVLHYRGSLEKRRARGVHKRRTPAAKVLLGKEADAALNLFGATEGHHRLTFERWQGCAKTLGRLLQKKRDAWLEAANHLAASRVLLWQGRLVDAERQAAAAVSLKEGWALGWVNLAWLRLWRGRATGAAKAAARALELAERVSSSAPERTRRDDLKWRFEAGQWSGVRRASTVAAAAHLAGGKISKAYYEAANAVKQAPSDPAAWTVRSLAAELKGHGEEAELWAVRALSAGPGYGPAVNRVAELALQAGRPDRAHRLCAAAGSALGALWRPLMLRCAARALAKSGRFKQAYAALRDLERSQTPVDEAYRMRMNVELERARIQVLQWLATGSKKRALEAFEGLSRANKNLHLEAVHSRAGADILELKCVISLEIDKAAAGRVCRQALTHLLAGPAVKTLNAMADLEGGNLPAALNAFRNAKASAQSLGFDAPHLELRVRLLERLSTSGARVARSALRPWLVRQVGLVPFRLYRSELL